MKFISIGKQGHQAVIDDEDLSRVLKYHWKMNRDQATGAVFAYAYSKSGKLTKSGRRERIQLSHFILGLQKGEKIYHRNGNRLDCRKENLFRKGGGNVYFDSPCTRKPYKATIWIKTKNFYLGHYPSEIWAKEAIENALPVVERVKNSALPKRQIQKELDFAVGREA